jgi:hypothetical protein
MKRTPSRRWIPGTLALVVTAAVGCGLSDLTEGAFSETGAGGASTTASTSATGETTGTSTATSSSSSSAGEGGASTTMSTSDTTTTTTTTGQPGGTLDCGDGLTCPQAPDSACCWDQSFGGGSSNGTCVTGPPDTSTCNTDPVNGGFDTRIECQLPSHCDPGMICCGNIESPAGFQYYPDVSCHSQCDWPGNRVICDPQNPVCPVVTTGSGNTVQTVCQQSQILPAGYHICTLP